MSEPSPLNMGEVTENLIQYLMKNYWIKMWRILEDNPD